MEAPGEYMNSLNWTKLKQNFINFKFKNTSMFSIALHFNNKNNKNLIRSNQQMLFWWRRRVTW